MTRDRGRSRTHPKDHRPTVDDESVPVVSDGSSRFLSALVLTYFVLLFSFVSITSMLQKSPTADEPNHLFAGYSYLQWGDFRANPQHPPLAKVWAALPLLAFDIKDPRPSRPHWELMAESKPGASIMDIAGDMFFVDNDGERLFFFARLQMIAVGILLGLFVYLWAKELYGFSAAVVSLSIFAFDPNIVAHSQLVHTDIPFATFFLISTYFFWRCLKRLNWINLVLTGLFFGLVVATKDSHAAILAAWCVMGLCRIVGAQPIECPMVGNGVISSRWSKGVLLAGLMLCSVMVAYVLVWASYGFRFSAIPGGRSLPMAEVMPPLDWLRGLVSFILGHHLFPEARVYGYLYTLQFLHWPSYLLGQISGSGFWSYFPIAFAVKTPLPTILLLLAATGMFMFKRKNRMYALLLLVPPAVYFLVAVLSRLNIGLRHILPIYPFLFIFVGTTVVELWRHGSRIKKAVLLFLGAWYLWSFVSIYPDYLAYFNELVGGPNNGHKVLVDSNLDWGQDLKGLKRWMDARGIEKIYLAYFGLADPEFYGIDAVYPPWTWFNFNPPATQTAKPPDYVAISATLLSGLYLDARGQEFARVLRSREPIAKIGYSILIYKIG